MQNKRIYKQRKLIAGRGIVDNFYKFGRNGVDYLKKGVVNGVRTYLPMGLHYGVNKVGDGGRALVDMAEKSANSKIRQITGSGMTEVKNMEGMRMPAIRTANRGMVMRDIQNALKGGKRVRAI